MFKFVPISLLILLTLTACASAGPADYSAANGGRFGFSDAKIETGRYRVIYKGSGGVPPFVVEQFALRRAAELTLENDQDWFRVVGKQVDGDRRGGVSVGGGVGSGRVGRRSSVGVGVGGDFGTIGSRAFYEVTLEILTGMGEQPEGEEVYNARSIIENATLRQNNDSQSQTNSNASAATTN